MENPLRIDVGGGLECIPGYTNVDLYAAGPDVVHAPAWALPYPDNSVDDLNCSHVLEHIEKRMVAPTLMEFRRVLKPGGKMVIEVPDLVWCCQNWLNSQSDGWDLDAIFGNQDPPGGQVHMTGFTVSILETRIRQAGFIHPIYLTQPWSHQQRCIRMETVK